MTIKRITVAQHERALVWKNKTFAGVLEPGKHWLIAPMSDVQAQLYDLTVPEFEHARVDFLVKEARATMEKYFDIVELTYIVMWYAGIHRANAIFDVEPPSRDGGIWIFDESDPEE